MSKAEDYLPLLIADGDPDSTIAGTGVQIGDAIISGEDKWQNASGGLEYDLLAEGAVYDAMAYPILAAIPGFAEPADLFPYAQTFTNRECVHVTLSYHSSMADRLADWQYSRTSEPSWGDRFGNTIDQGFGESSETQEVFGPNSTTLQEFTVEQVPYNGLVLGVHLHTTYQNNNATVHYYDSEDNVLLRVRVYTAASAFRAYFEIQAGGSTQTLSPLGSSIDLACMGMYLNGEYVLRGLSNVGGTVSIPADLSQAHRVTVVTSLTSHTSGTGTFGYSYVDRVKLELHGGVSTPNMPQETGSPFPYKIVADLTPDVAEQVDPLVARRAEAASKAGATYPVPEEDAPLYIETLEATVAENPSVAPSMSEYPTARNLATSLDNQYPGTSEAAFNSSLATLETEVQEWLDTPDRAVLDYGGIVPLVRRTALQQQMHSSHDVATPGPITLANGDIYHLINAGISASGYLLKETSSGITKVSLPWGDVVTPFDLTSDGTTLLLTSNGVGAAEVSYIHKSTDGINWTLVHSHTPGDFTAMTGGIVRSDIVIAQAFAMSNGEWFVRIGVSSAATVGYSIVRIYNSALTSYEDWQWDGTGYPATLDITEFDGKLIIAGSKRGTYNGRIWYSTDRGRSFTEASIPQRTISGVYKLHVGLDGALYALARYYDSALWKTTDGVNWTEVFNSGYKMLPGQTAGMGIGMGTLNILQVSANEWYLFSSWNLGSNTHILHTTDNWATGTYYSVQYKKTGAEPEGLTLRHEYVMGAPYE